MSFREGAAGDVVEKFVLELDGLRLEGLEREYLRGIKPFEQNCDRAADQR